MLFMGVLMTYVYVGLFTLIYVGVLHFHNNICLEKVGQKWFGNL